MVSGAKHKVDGISYELANLLFKFNPSDSYG